MTLILSIGDECSTCAGKTVTGLFVPQRLDMFLKEEEFKRKFIQK